MKKIISIMLSAILLCTFMTGALADGSYNTSYPLLAALNILNGDPNGNLRLEEPITRAEFSKVAVAASPYRNAVAKNLTISPFSDVSYTHWAAPYIQTALEHGLMRGYLDATFQPNAGVLLEEAVTVALRLLGYDDSDFGDSWPYSQLGLAGNLGLTVGIEKSAGQALTRGDTAALFDRLLYTQPKDSAQANEKYLQTFDMQLIENAVLLASNMQDPSIAAGTVFTSSGTFKTGSIAPEDIGRRGDLIVQSDNSILLFLPYLQTKETHTITAIIGTDLLLDDKGLANIDAQLPVYYQSKTICYQDVSQYAQYGGTFDIYRNANDTIEYAVLLNNHTEQNSLERYVIYSALGDAVIAYRNGSSEQLKIDENTTAYNGTQATTYGALKSNLEMGDILYAKRDNSGKIASVSFEKGAMLGPVTVRSAGLDALFNGAAKTAEILRNGQKASALQVNDVAYYSADLNMILAYDKKVTGVYENALPNKDMPTEIILSGTTYPIESLAAFQALSSSGSLQYGDTITLYLGKNGEIADVASPAANMTGYLLESINKEFINLDGEKYSAYENIVILPDGSKQTYTSDSSYAEYVNSIVTVTVQDGKARLTRSGAGSDLSGKVDASSMRIGNHRVAGNIQILDIAATGKDQDCAYTRTYMQRLDGINLRSSQILYSAANANGELSALILYNVTGDAGKYGIMMEAENTVLQMYASGTYTYDIGGVTKTETLANRALSVGSHTACQFQLKDGKLDNAIELTKLNEDIVRVDNTSLTTEKGTYLLSDDVIAYHAGYDGTFRMIPHSALLSLDSAHMSAYYDKPQSSGGRIRIIIVLD